MKKVVVCGAGIGGMVSAIYLAHKGHDVKILEKNLKAGGKLNEYCSNGFRFDVGPSQIMMPSVLKDFFNDINRDISDYIELIELESSCRYYWNDGSSFNLFCDESSLSKELVKVFGDTEKNNFFQCLDYGKRFYELLNGDFLVEEFNIRNFITKNRMKNVTKFISGKSINDLSIKFFKDKRLRQLMDRYATYNGSSPYLTPQFFSIVPYVEHKYGTWYVNGGIYKITQALENLCKEMKIEIFYGFELIDTETEFKKISKLIFRTSEDKNYEKAEFDYVISNFTNNKNFLDEDYFKVDDWSCSAFILLIGMNKEFNVLAPHNVFFSDDYEKECINIFEKKIPADDMTIFISISKKINNNDAPDNCENWCVVVKTSHLSKNIIWDDETKNRYKEKVIDKIESFSFLFEESIRNHIKFCEIYTPDDFFKDYNSEFGSIYGLSSNSLYTLMKRPKNKSKKYTNLFFVGGNTFPGGGIPTCFLSGKIVSGLVK